MFLKKASFKFLRVVLIFYSFSLIFTHFGILAHAYFPSTGDIAGDAHFSIDKAWEYRKSTKKYSDVDLFLVMVHELGHSLGLDHSHRKEDIMYGMYKYKDWTGSKGPEWWRDILSNRERCGSL